jgi:hypothetical protein
MAHGKEGFHYGRLSAAPRTEILQSGERTRLKVTRLRAKERKSSLAGQTDAFAMLAHLLPPRADDADHGGAAGARSSA